MTFHHRRFALRRFARNAKPPTEFVSTRTCRPCDGTGIGAGWDACPHCDGTGEADPAADVTLRRTNVWENGPALATDEQRDRLVALIDARDPTLADVVAASRDLRTEHPLTAATVQRHIEALGPPPWDGVDVRFTTADGTVKSGRTIGWYGGDRTEVHVHVGVAGFWAVPPAELTVRG